MSVKWPEFQEISFFQIEYPPRKSSHLERDGDPQEIIESMVKLFNDRHPSKNEETGEFKEISIDPEKWEPISFQFSIKWFLSRRNFLTSGIQKTVKYLTTDEELETGSTTEHHLIFLFKQYEVKCEADKAQKIWKIFALSTNKAFLVIQKHVNFTFPLQLAKRIAIPGYHKKTKIELTGNNIASTELSKYFTPFTDLPLEKLDEINKEFMTQIKPESSLYSETQAFKKFRKKSEDDPKSVLVDIAELHIRFHGQFSLKEHVELANRFLKILDPENNYLGDQPHPDFEYLENVRVVREENGELIPILETLILEDIYHSFCGKKNCKLDFYHHHYEQYLKASEFSLRKKRGKTPLKAWTVCPTSDEVIEVLKKKIKVESKEEFFDEFNKLVFDFKSPDDRNPKRFPLREYFKGEIFYNEKTYFYLDGKWCEIKGQYYSFVQNEFFKKMRTVFVDRETENFPLPWVSKKEWYSFSLKDVKNQDPNKDVPLFWDQILQVKIQYLTNKGNIVSSELGEEIIRENEVIQKHLNLLSKLLKGKEPITSRSLENSGIKKSSDRKAILKALKNPHPIIAQKGKKGFSIGGNPKYFSQSLKDLMGEKIFQFFETLWIRFCNYRSREEDYNRRYLFDQYPFHNGKPFDINEGFLVLDQIYPGEQRFFELCDIVKYDQIETDLIQVKGEFGKNTAKACSQLRTAAEALHKSLAIGEKSDIIRPLFRSAVDSTAESLYRTKLKEQLLSFGETKEEAENQFCKLFKGRKINFVYAFLDYSQKEKSLGVELKQRYEFKQTDFEDPKYWQNPEGACLEPKKIYEKLIQKKLLDKRGRLTDKFVDLNKFSQFKFSYAANETNRKEIYGLLRSHLSQFKSFIAKKELLNTKQYIENLGFGFKIYQISRDGEFSREFFPEEEVEDSLSPGPLFTEMFRFGNAFYEKKQTAGGGACALHALLGEEAEGEIISQGEDEDPHTAAKMDFIHQLGQNLQKIEGLKGKVVSFFEAFLKEVQGEKPSPEAMKLFSHKHFNLQVFKTEKKQIHFDLEKNKKKRASDFFEYFKGVRNIVLRAHFLSVFRSYKKEWKTINEQQLLQEIEKNPTKVINGIWNDLYRKIPSEEKKQFHQILQLINQNQKQYSNFEQNWIEKNFDQVYKRYQEIMVQPSFYLSNFELEIAAILYKKKTVVFPTENDKTRFDNPQYYNMMPGELPDVVIVNQTNYHYSRCLASHHPIEASDESISQSA